MIDFCCLMAVFEMSFGSLMLIFQVFHAFMFSRIKFNVKMLKTGEKKEEE